MLDYDRYSHILKLEVIIFNKTGKHDSNIEITRLGLQLTNSLCVTSVSTESIPRNQEHKERPEQSFCTP